MYRFHHRTSSLIFVNCNLVSIFTELFKTLGFNMSSVSGVITIKRYGELLSPFVYFVFTFLKSRSSKNSLTFSSDLSYGFIFNSLSSYNPNFAFSFNNNSNATQLSNGLSLPPYITLLLPSISTS